MHPPDAAADRPFLPTLGQGLVLWGLYMVAKSIGGAFAGGIERSWPGSPATVGISLLILTATPLSVVWLGKRLTGRPWSQVLPFHRPSPWTSFLVAVSVAGLQFANLGLLVSLAPFLPRGESPLAAQLATAPVVKAVLIAPLTEETMFRGLLLDGFLLAYRLWTAILLSAVLFAAIHADPVQAATALASGIFLSWLMAESRNIALPLLAHAVANGVVVALLALPAMVGPLVRYPVTFGIPGLSCLAPGTFLLRRALRPAPLRSLTMGVA